MQAVAFTPPINTSEDDDDELNVISIQPVYPYNPTQPFVKFLDLLTGGYRLEACADVGYLRCRLVEAAQVCGIGTQGAGCGLWRSHPDGQGTNRLACNACRSIGGPPSLIGTPWPYLAVVRLTECANVWNASSSVGSIGQEMLLALA